MCPSRFSLNWKLNPNRNLLGDVGDEAGETEAPAVAAAKATAAEDILLRRLEDLCDVTTTPGAGDGGDELGLRANVGERSTSMGLVRPESIVDISPILSSEFCLLSFLGMNRFNGLLGGETVGDRKCDDREGVNGEFLGDGGDLRNCVGGLGDNIASKTVS